MARIITDAVYAQIVKVLLENETVALFQKLLLSPKTSEAEQTTEKGEEKEESGGSE